MDLRFQPFELNPDMGPEGQDVSEYLGEKYGSTQEEQAQVHESIRQRGAEVGFQFAPGGRGRVWNTFDAHRLIYWAGAEARSGQQLMLKRSLMEGYHGRGESPADRSVLLKAVVHAGLSERRAGEVLDSDEFAHSVRERENFYAANGIRSVPSVVLNGRYLVTGGQPPSVFEQMLRQLQQELEAPRA
ncbi:DsbA family oxidoreductase [Hydrogenophaga sp. 5NK40-0174]